MRPLLKRLCSDMGKRPPRPLYLWEEGIPGRVSTNAMKLWGTGAYSGPRMTFRVPATSNRPRSGFSQWMQNDVVLPSRESMLSPEVFPDCRSRRRKGLEQTQIGLLPVDAVTALCVTGHLVKTSVRIGTGLSPVVHPVDLPILEHGHVGTEGTLPGPIESQGHFCLGTRFVENLCFPLKSSWRPLGKVPGFPEASQGPSWQGLRPRPLVASPRSEVEEAERA